MFDATNRNIFYCRSFGFKKVWGVAANNPQQPPPQNQGNRLSDLTFSRFTMDPVPKMDGRNMTKLHMYRSYRVEATVVNKGDADASAFKVRTICTRDGRPYSLGEKNVSFLPSGSSVVVSYDIFPSSAGGGDCEMQTLIDADNQIPESDESEHSNIWKRAATVLP
jgi:hypothetical protein